jgi:carbamoyl-phosphate synthase large subunit
MFKAKKPVVVAITCVGGRLIYDFVAALRAAEDFEAVILGIDADPTAQGRLLCDRFETLPIAEKAPEQYMAGLRRLHAEMKIDVFVALSEGESRLIAAHRDELLALGLRPSVSPRDVVSTMTDKLLLLRKLTEEGIDVGRFAEVNSREQAHAALAELGYPRDRVVLKPRDGRGSRGVLIADGGETVFRRLLPERFCGTGDFDALVSAMADEGMPFTNLIAVPYYDGPVYDVDCIAIKGTVVDVAARLRQLKNPVWPTSTGHRIAMEPHVLDYARALGRALAIDGAGDFDIVVIDGKRPLLFDAGARFSGSIGGSFTAGYNFPAQLVRVLMGMPRREYAIEDGCVLRPYITMARIPSKNQHDLL